MSALVRICQASLPRSLGAEMRREFIALLGGATVAWPLAANAQQPAMPVIRYKPAQKENSHEFKSVHRLLEASRTVPIVFAQGLDPVGAGFVESLARPGGNATGFTQFEYSLSGKWLEMLKEVAPGVTRVGVLREAGPAGIGQWAIIQAVAQSLGVELSPINLRDASEIERAVTAFARAPSGGLIVVVSASSQFHRELIVSLAARHQLPVIYPYQFFVTGGGLMSYGPDLINQYRRAASYVDRILKGEKPADLPVHAQTKYELVINLRPRKRSGSTCRRRCSRAPTG